MTSAACIFSISSIALNGSRRRRSRNSFSEMYPSPSLSHENSSSRAALRYRPPVFDGPSALPAIESPMACATSSTSSVFEPSVSNFLNSASTRSAGTSSGASGAGGLSFQASAAAFFASDARGSRARSLARSSRSRTARSSAGTPTEAPFRPRRLCSAPSTARRAALAAGPPIRAGARVLAAIPGGPAGRCWPEGVSSSRGPCCPPCPPPSLPGLVCRGFVAWTSTLEELPVQTLKLSA